MRERGIGSIREEIEEFGSIREAIDWMAETRGEAVFLISAETGRVLTFEGLQQQLRATWARLREAGLEHGDKVAFLMDNGLFTAQLFLGTMYGGFVSVPLNVRAGASQLSYMLEHCDAKIVFVASQYASLIKEVMTDVRRSIEVISADIDGSYQENETPYTIDESPPLEGDDAAMVMYSSGTTGQPKGAVHTHGSVLAHGKNSILSHELTAADRSLLVLPLYHINAECVTLIPTLMSGGSVVIPRGFVVSEFWNWLDDYRCTWSALVPTIISQLLDWKDPKAESRAAALQRVRFLRTSSAPLSPALHREFLDKFNLPLIQAMGSSEAGNVFSNPAPPGTNKIGSPGLPWGFETKIVGREGEELPAGEAGEVLIRGEGMMQGYYKDPAGTTTALDADSWLHTGDLAYRDKEGYFFIVGRSKELIIKGGMNIAPKQIDEVLESHPAVLEAAAVGVPDRYVGEDIVAFAILREGAKCDEGELLSFCESRLGHFKTPSRIHFVSDLPKGPSGKVQRLKLQEEAVERSVSAAATDNSPILSVDQRPPSNPIEQIIAETWAKLLKQPHVDPRSNFFSLGGHSLLAIQCLSLLREKLPIRISLADFFENATVAEQATLIRSRLRPGHLPSADATISWERELLRKARPSAVDETIPPRDRSVPCALSPDQQRIWFMEQMIAGAPVYNEAEAARLRGELNVEVLEKALNVVVARHENLRTTIQAIGDKPSAFVHDSWPLQFKQIDLSSLPPAQREAEVERLLIDEPRLPYHLGSQPGIRVTLLRLGQTDHVIILMMHHIIGDWASIGVLWRDLSALYRAGCRAQPLELPALPVQPADYAVWQQQLSTREEFAQDLAYWEETLRGAPALLHLPTDRPRPLIFSYRGARRRFRIPTTLVLALRDCSRQEKVSLFTLFAAALNTLLYRYTGQEDILVGIPLADRDRPELQSVIGFLLHTHVLRTRLSGDLSFRELLLLVQKGVLDLYAHRSPPFDRVVRKIKPERTLSHSPLFEVMLNWRDRDQQPSFIGLDGLEIESVLAESRTAKFDLTLTLTDSDDDIDLEVEYATDLFDEARIERMVGHFRTLLEAAAASPDQRLADLPLLTDTERQQLLVEWNKTAIDYPKDRCMHELFEQQVERTPGAIAVVFEDEQLSYRQLNERANKLARHLQELGVGPDTLVALCVERSLDMVVGLLGILKAGGAYVPLDPGYPSERLAFMLRDSGALLLLTHQRLCGQLKTASRNAKLLCLDADWDTIAASPAENPESRPGPENLAYVIYTSGSTGEPKGVEIKHRNLVNVLWTMAREPGFAPRDKLLAVTTISFDIAALELFLPLVAGGQVELAPASELSDGFALRQRLELSGATVMQATPATWAMLIEAGWSGNRDLRVLCGGEAVAPALADGLLMRAKEVWNVYGPTETTIWSSFERIRTGQPITIGRPIANTQFYVVDRSCRPVPIGVPGELLVGGDGLARGYFRRPELTAERFVANPFSREPGARLYKTGDLVRRLPTGAVEFLGRLDHQVKIRGFRIELGEIESALAAHPEVREAVALAREDVPGDKRLVAYVVADSKGVKDLDDAGIEVEKVGEWKAAWDDTYSALQTGNEPTFAGWKSSYADEPIPESEMREWLACTIARIAALKPDRILEIGCGVGLLLERLAPICQAYLGTDVSASAIAKLERWTKEQNGMRHVKLARREAIDFSGIDPGSIDTVILNSVVQYFPHYNYLLKVLENAVEMVSPRGSVFIGDIRHFGLLSVFHTSVQLTRASAAANLGELMNRIELAGDRENELSIDPKFFAALQQRLPRIGAVEVLVKRGRSDNELTRFRYDAVLHVGEVATTKPEQLIEWGERDGSLGEISSLLAAGQLAALAIGNVPNRRLSRDLAAARVLKTAHGLRNAGELRQLIGTADVDGENPKSFWALGEKYGYETKVSWRSGSREGRFDVLFVSQARVSNTAVAVDARSKSVPQAVPPRPWSDYFNDPSAALSRQRFSSHLRETLKSSLPDYMIPSAFIVLDRFPLTPNGKVDRKALPKPDLQSSNPDEFALPVTETEKAIAGIWRQALGVERVGLHDNFFELGGHSLLAVRVIAELNKTLSVYMNVPQFFQNPTIERLASSLEQEHHFRPKPRVLRLQPGQVDPPLYFVGAGPVEIRIAKLMGENRAIFGTDVPMPIAWRRAIANADRAAWPTMEQLGALHGEVVRAHAGTSPCVVAGYSFQGRVVIEVARALQRLGGNLALVLLIDSSAWTGTAHGIRQTVWRNLPWIRREPATETPDAAHMKSFSASLHDSWRLLRWLLAQAPPRIKRRLELARSHNPYVDDANGFVDEEGVPVGLADMQLFFRVLMMSFQPPPLDAAAVLFRTMHPSDEMLPSDALDNGWGGRFTRGLEIVQAKGDHWSLVKDERNAAALARQINAVLDRYSDSRSERRAPGRTRSTQREI